MIDDEDLLMAVLNSAPVVSGEVSEQLAGARGETMARGFGGTGTQQELAGLRTVRGAIQRLIRGDREGAVELGAVLGPVALRPQVTHAGVEWVLAAEPESLLAARVGLAWARAVEAMPGRLKPCANEDCNLYLLDHSRPGTARWCSMAACGNRAKARTHARRTRPATS